MTAYLFFDNEATGLIDFKNKEAPKPRIIQLAAILTDEEGNELDRMMEYVRPDGWEVPAEITELTGITTEKLEMLGLPMPEVLAKFNAMKARCTHRVAHNLAYDKSLLAIEAEIYGVAHDSSGIESFCIMHGTSKIVSEGKKYKPAKLSEAYEFFMKKPLEKAHDAYADATACMEIFFALKKWQAASTAAA